MKCPKCGEPDAKDVALLLSVSFLCTNPDCDYFDSTYAAGQLIGELPNIKADFDWIYPGDELEFPDLAV